jgi:hypothetical protein
VRVIDIGFWTFRDCTGLKPEVRAEIGQRFGNLVF